LPFSQEDYNANVDDPINFRKCIDDRIELFQELLPPEIAKGYMMKDIYYSKKQSVPNRRIESEDLSSGAKKNNIPSVIANPIKKLRQNLAPYNPQTVKKLNGRTIPAERLNKFRYYGNWLHNFFSIHLLKSPVRNADIYHGFIGFNG